MNNFIQRIAKNIQVMQSPTALCVVVLLLGACSQKPAQNSISLSGDTLSAPLPSALLTIDETNLIVNVIDGGNTIPCGGLTVDQVAGTFSCNITLSAGSHSISLMYSINDVTYGKVPVMSSSTVTINVTAGQTSTANFDTAIFTNIDTDGDGVSNLAELNAGTNPNSTICKFGSSLFDRCTLG